MGDENQGHNRGAEGGGKGSAIPGFFYLARAFRFVPAMRERDTSLFLPSKSRWIDWRRC